MRPPPRPHPTHYASMTGRAPSPAESLSSSGASNAGIKRKGEKILTRTMAKKQTFTWLCGVGAASEREVRENSGVVVSTTESRRSR